MTSPTLGEAIDLAFATAQELADEANALWETKSPLRSWDGFQVEPCTVPRHWAPTFVITLFGGAQFVGLAGEVREAAREHVAHRVQRRGSC